jgi:hypothetical protein
MEKGVCLHRYRGAVSISAKNGHEESLKNNNTEKSTGRNKMFVDTTKKTKQSTWHSFDQTRLDPVGRITPTIRMRTNWQITCKSIFLRNFVNAGQ